ncbi:hypothetical protein ACTAB0_11685 [Pseudomonas syringae]|uniref:hypothetical protein n=1 Tax=Pseudomonas syringae TaxID=317 RepID=UPI003F78F4A0
MSNELRKHLENCRKPVDEFQREDRYIVIKRSDLKKVPASYRSHLVDPMFSLLAHLPNRECLVIESDWPEYEPAWKAIEARMSGAAPPPPALGGVPAGLDLQRIVTEALMGMIAAVTSTSPPANEPPPPFIQAGIDRAVSRISAHLAPLQAEIEHLRAGGALIVQHMNDYKKERDQLKAEAETLSETTMAQESMIEQLKAWRDEQAKALATLISVARTVNRNAASETRVPSDDEPQYRQRKEWIEYLLETCAEAEALPKPTGSEQV